MNAHFPIFSSATIATIGALLFACSSSGVVVAPSDAGTAATDAHATPDTGLPKKGPDAGACVALDAPCSAASSCCGAYVCANHGNGEMSCAESIPPQSQCPQVGYRRCPNGLATTQSDVDECTQFKTNLKCGAQFTALLGCADQNLSCGPDGKDDTSQYESVCKAQIQAQVSCLAGN